MSDPARTSAIGSALEGTRPMIGLTLRRERRHGSAWYLVSGLLLIMIAAGIVATYPTDAARQALAGSVNASAGELFIIGPVASTDIGGIAVWRTLGIAGIALGLASSLTMVRNTRRQEEDGTVELLGSAAIGRAAPLTGTFVVCAVGSIVAGGVTAAGFVVLGAAGTGSVLVGAQVASLGLLAAAVAGLAGQFVQTARAATAVSMAVVAAFFLLRGAGDALGGSAVWLSPFGWIAAVRPFAHDDARMFLPVLALTVALAAAAVGIASRRDLGAGLLPDRPGPARARPALRGPNSLALRTSRATIAGWAIGALVVGLLIGAVSSTVDEQIDLALGRAAGGSPGLIPVALYLSPLFAAVLGVQTTLRLRGEVTSGRADAVLSRPVARSSWLLAHASVGAVASLSVLVCLGIGIGLAHGADPGALAGSVVAGALRAPAAWVFIGLTTLLLATVPRVATAVAFVVIGVVQALEFAVEFRLLPPEALVGSPFALVPQLPDGDAHVWPTLVLVLVAVGLTAIATTRIRHLDIR